ncbi:hypothetical protein EP7_004684 [Isosphaeraceae bacterium EP7]
MSTDAAPLVKRAPSTLRADHPETAWLPTGPLAQATAVAALAAVFVLAGPQFQLGREEARLGIAAAERLGPMGQVFGGWDPGVWPLPVILGKLWAALWQGPVDTWAVRGPAALAALAIGVMASRRVSLALSPRAGLLVGLAWFSCLGAMDRSTAFGLDMIVGLGTVLALDRIIGRRCDAVAGAWAGLAFLAGGWPPLAVVLMATIVIGRPEAWVGVGFLLPVAATIAGWSAWAIAAAPTGAWVSALTLPLTKGSAWWMAPGLLLAALPWSPFALLALRPSIRQGWSEPGRKVVVGWMQTAAAALVAGTLVPGLASSARIPALVGLAIAAGACWDRIAFGGDSIGRRMRRLSLIIALALAWTWALIAMMGGTYLGLAVSYYRGLAIVVACVSAGAFVSVLMGFWKNAPLRSLAGMMLMALAMKLSYAGFVIPEWNYRAGQGPWGRAIDQWVPARSPIYVTHGWGADLAFATGHPFRQLADASLLARQPGARPLFTLLHPEEFKHWPKDAPPLMEVHTFMDELGYPRVLARTTEPYSWRAMAEAARRGE